MRYIILLFFIANQISWGQDTLAYNDVVIKISSEGKTIYYENNKFTGYLHYVTDDLICTETVSEGIITEKKCLKNPDYVPEIWERELYCKTFYDTISKKINRKELLKEQNLISRNKVCEDCDSGFQRQIVYKFKEKPFTGFAATDDSLYYYRDGILKYCNTYWQNGSLKEYIEFDDELKNGKYEIYSCNNVKELEGYYINDRKEGIWSNYFSEKYTLIHENYLNGKKSGLWYYYIKDKVVMCEFYRNGKKNYYYTSEYVDNTEIRIYFKDGVKISEETYIDGYLYEYRKL